MIDIKLLEQLCLCNGISGDEGNVRNLIINEIKDCADDIKTDNLGNLIVFKKGKKSAKSKLMVSAHMDEVGLMVTDITSDGYLKFDEVGGIDRRVLPGKRVCIGRNGLNGVIGVKPIHLTNGDEKTAVPKMNDMYIDIGAESREDALKYVKYRSLTDNSDSFPQHINLRNKESGWSHYAYSVEFAYADKKRYLCKNGDDPFMQLFVKDYILRESCSSCHFKGYHRVSDITLGDFWGIWNINPKMDDNKGTSLILTHTAKGEKMMNAVSENIKCEQVYLEQAARENPSLLRSSVHKQNRDIVLKTIESENFQEILPLLQVKQPQRRSKKEIIKRVLKKLCGLG